MAVIKAFNALRPEKSIVNEVAELPYDVVNSEEARSIAAGNDKSFFHITKPEIDMEPGIDIYDTSVYSAGKTKLEEFIAKNILKQDGEAFLYLYTQVMNGKAQTGLVAAVSIDDYLENRIKKHELTREDKEKDRTTHLDILDANTGPVFLLYREKGDKKNLFIEGMKIEPDYDFEAEDGVRHIVRTIKDSSMIEDFVAGFKNEIMYIADGHHRAASAARVGEKRRKENPDFDGSEEFNYFLTVIFPHDELNILAYNRAVRDLNGMTGEKFLETLSEKFKVVEEGKKEPQKTCQFCMYFDEKWYTLEPNFEVSGDPINGLDVKILQDNLLQPLLGIEDPRTDNRISFIGGIRGTAELEKLVDSGDYKVAFSMFPTTLDQLMNVSDVDGIMPPKSTWFEPKLRSGLFVHLLGE